MNRFLKKVGEEAFILIGGGPLNSPEHIRAAVSGGMDVLKIHLNLDFPATGVKYGSFQEEYPKMKAVLEEFGKDFPIGVVPGWEAMVSKEEYLELEKMGFSFLNVFAHHFPVWMWEISKLPKLVAIDQAVTREQIEELESLGMDAIEAAIITPEGFRKRLKIIDIANYKLLVKWTDKPVFVAAQRWIYPEDIQILRRIGVRGLIFGSQMLKTGSTSEETERIVSGLKKAILSSS